MSVTGHKKASASIEVKRIAATCGFEFCGISEAGFLESEAPRLERWLNAGMHGQMRYMENHFDKRLDPRLLVPGAKSVISVLFNYFPDPSSKQIEDAPQISKYAWGEDYHFVIKDKLKVFLAELTLRFGDIAARIFVDSAPVMDKTWAAKGGLGWVGKNTNLINRSIGSFFFIAEIICDLELEPDGPVKDYCGTCTRCIDSCPTDAISEPYVVNGSKCISYFTIELREAISDVNANAFENWAFGCDICQDVCPWNRFSKPHKEARFTPKKEFLEMGREAWYEMTKEVFDNLFSGSALQRSGYEGLKRNLRFIGGGESQPNEG